MLKPLRYEARYPGKFPNFQLLDVGERPVALDLMSSFLSHRERDAKVGAIAARNPKGWAWDTAQGVSISDLPPQPGADRDWKHRGRRRPQQRPRAKPPRRLNNGSTRERYADLSSPRFGAMRLATTALHRP